MQGVLSYTRWLASGFVGYRDQVLGCAWKAEWWLKCES